MSWTNADGLTVLMHEEQGIAKDGGYAAAFSKKTVKLKLDLTGNKAVAANDAFIPAGSFITSAVLVVTTATAGGTSINFGLANAAGDVIDADGIDAAVSNANMAANKAVVCNGALVSGTATVGTANAYIVTANTGTFTAGEAVLVVEYVEV